MLGFARLSLNKKITLIILAISCASLLVALSLMAYNDVRLFKKDFVAQTETTVNMLASNIAPALLFNDPRAAADMLDVLQGDPQIELAAVFDQQNSLIAQYPRHGVRISYQDTAGEAVSFSRDYLEVTRPVRSDDGVLGKVTIRKTLDSVYGRFDQYTGALFLTFFFSIAFTIALSAVLQRIISRPLSELVDIAKQITRERQYSKRVDHTRQDEIGVLLDAFNDMMAAIQNRDKQLLKHSEELEMLVELRTEQLHERANFDALTGLPNRYLLLDRLSQAIKESRRKNSRLSVLFLDLDRFKNINDNLGHEVGDQVLRVVADRLIHTVRSEDTVSRLGGDEFLILLRDTNDHDSAATVAENIVAALRTPVHVLGHTLHLGTSIGISIFPDHGQTADALMKRADASMYAAKRRDPGGFAFYHPDIEHESRQRLTLETNLRHAILHNEFRAVYQPQHCAKTQKLIGFESLLRWNKDSHEPTPTATLISLAEEIGLIDKIDELMIHQVCEQMRRLRARGLPDIKVSINISAKQLMDSGFIDILQQNLDKHSIAQQSIQIEITEETFVHASEIILKCLQRLKDFGVTVAVDDFGKGYSSLNYLRSFPIDTLKIDGCFILDLEKDKASRGIVASTIALGHSLGLTMVAECVETEFQANFLAEHNCDILQGYYFSKAIETDRVLEYVSGNDILGPQQTIAREQSS
jgi:diguanylate cyclase (GGDEF)-like protein